MVHSCSLGCPGLQEKGELHERGRPRENMTSPYGTPLTIQRETCGFNITQSEQWQRMRIQAGGEMVSFMDGDGGSETVYKRRRTNGASPPTEALTPVQQRQTARHRKQKLMSRLSDSGIEEDLGSPPIPSQARLVVSPLRLDEPETPAGQQLSNWYLQYGDIGYRIQREKEEQFHPCKSLARQPQVGFKTHNT